MTRFENLLGRPITLVVRDLKRPYTVTVEGVDTAGIWVSGAALKDLTPQHQAKEETEMVAFIPFSEIKSAAIRKPKGGPKITAV